jgi:hypothetical protein
MGLGVLIAACGVRSPCGVRRRDFALRTSHFRLRTPHFALRTSGKNCRQPDSLGPNKRLYYMRDMGRGERKARAAGRCNPEAPWSERYGPEKELPFIIKSTRTFANSGG